MGSDGSADIPVVVETVITASELKGYYEKMGGQPTTAADAVRILDVILDRDASEDLTVADIRSAITALRDSVVVLSSQIENLHRLNGLLYAELIEQGVTIENEELLNELNYAQ